MKTEYIGLTPLAPGQPISVIRRTFGESGSGRSAYLQAGLHADEHPGILVLHYLTALLCEYEAQGRLIGEIVIIPFANPVGLLQNVLGGWAGRFSLADGENFNRRFPDISSLLECRPPLPDETPAESMQAALKDNWTNDTVGQMKNVLLSEAVRHDLVLDLHCDTDSVLHLYTNHHNAGRATILAGHLGAKVVFVEEFAGGNPFDESVYHAWKWFADRQLIAAEALPFSVTVELRGQADVSIDLAYQDAQGIINFLISEGVISSAGQTLTDKTLHACDVNLYPLEGASHVPAPENGILVWHKRPGDRVSRGECIAEIIQPDRLPGAGRTYVYSDVEGVMVARPVMKMVRAGQRVALLAGTEKLQKRRPGNLLNHF